MAVVSTLSPPPPPPPIHLIPPITIAVRPRGSFDWSGPPPDLYRFNGLVLIPVCPVQLEPGEGYYAVIKGRERGVFLTWCVHAVSSEFIC